MAATAAKKGGAVKAPESKPANSKGGKVKETAKKVGDRVKNAAKKVEKAIKEYGDALKAAYENGWQDGYDAADKLPKRAGARHAATAGYSNGIKTKQKENKVKAKVEKNGKGGKKDKPAPKNTGAKNGGKKAK